MKLKTLLQQKRGDIRKRWISLTLETYPPDVSNFLKLENNRFANPVGHAISIGTEILLDEVIHGKNSDNIIPALDSIIRIRAVQNFPPSQAIAFVFLLKKAMREELKIRGQGFKTEEKHEIFEELPLFEMRIDKLAGLAFDVYVKCRDDINRIKIGEVKTELAMANRIKTIMEARGKKQGNSKL